MSERPDRVARRGPSGRANSQRCGALPSWAACASPTRSSSAGTTCPAGPPWPRSRWPAAGAAADVTLVGVAGRHRRPPDAPWRSPIPVRPAAARPPVAVRGVAAAAAGRSVERATGPVDVAHATGARPVPEPTPRSSSRARPGVPPRPERFTRPGRAGDAPQPGRDPRPRRPRAVPAARPATTTCVAAGIEPDAAARRAARGVDATPAADDRGPRRAPPLRPPRAVRPVRRHDRAAQEPAPPGGGGRRARRPAAARRRRRRRMGRRRRAELGGDVRFLGFVPAERPAGAVRRQPTVFAYPSEREGFGLPVAEAMAQGTPGRHQRAARRPRRSPAARPCSSTRSTSTPSPPASTSARPGRAELAAAGRARAAELTWEATRRATARRLPRGRWTEGR